ncbi:MAG: competence/damage-inducible protein A [Saprospiraceae bacterium]
MNAFIMPIGDEVLIGQVIDTNSSWIAQHLNLQGISIRHAMSVGDTHDEIIKGIGYGLSQADLLFITGGLGPTKDDITKKAIADFLGVEMFFHEETWIKIQKIFERLGKPAGDAHYEQCYMPEGVRILDNKMGTAPGMWFEYQGKVIISMPGVPTEMKYIMEYQALPLIKERFKGQPIAHRTILTAGAGETEIAALLEDFENKLPSHIKLAYLPAFSQVRLRLTGKGDDEKRLNQQLDEFANEMETLVSRFAFGRDDQSIESVIGDILRKKGKTIATAESCTGGLISHKIISIPGSSDYFTGSIIAYSYEAKMNLINVRKSTLEQYGAVSENCVREMVSGVLKATGADYAISISGIAGPGGGTEDKPVGTIWVAVGNANEIVARKISINRNRAINIEYSANVALAMMLNFLKRA